MIGFGICLLVVATLALEIATLWAIGIVSLIAGAVLHARGAVGHAVPGGRHLT